MVGVGGKHVNAHCPQGSLPLCILPIRTRRYVTPTICLLTQQPNQKSPISVTSHPCFSTLNIAQKHTNMTIQSYVFVVGCKGWYIAEEEAGGERQGSVWGYRPSGVLCGCAAHIAQRQQ